MRERGGMIAGARGAAGGMTLIEIMITVTVLSVFVAAGGLVLASLARQGELNHDLAVVNSEVGNALALVHAAPFDSIAQELLNDGSIDLGNFTYRKILTGAPTYLPQGSVTVQFRDVSAGGVLPDPLCIDVTAEWTNTHSGHQLRSFVTVRTR